MALYRGLWGLAVCWLLLISAACGSDDESPPTGAPATGGNAGSSGKGSAGSGGSEPDASAGTGGAAAGSGGSAAGTAGSGGTTDAAAGSAGTGGAASAVAGPAGGTVSDATGDIVLVIPAGALVGETRFTFTRVASVGAPSTDYTLLDGTGFRIEWTGAGFTATAAVTVRIREPATPLLASGTLEQSAPVAVLECANRDVVIYPDVNQSNGYETDGIAMHCGSGGGGSASVGIATPSPSAVPSITTEPSDLNATAGDAAGFSVVATGSAPLSYQWRRNGTDIPGATSASYSLSNAQLGDTGAKFSVRVSNRLGNDLSREAVLTVGPPRTPTWSTTAPLSAFGTGVDLPQMGSLAGLDFVVWNDGGTLHGATTVTGPGYAPIAALAEPARGRPHVLTGGNLLGGFIVFVDDSAGGSCGAGTGDTLFAVGVRVGSEGQSYPRSGRFTLYKSSTGCIGQFSAALIDTEATNPRPIAYALNEVGSGVLKVGSGGGVYSDTTGGWVETTAAPATLALDAECSGGSFLTEDSLAGRRQAFYSAPVPPTTAVLTWVANDNLCAATLDNGTWSRGTRVFDKALELPEPAAAIYGDGTTLIVASRVIDPQVTPYSYAMTAATRSGTSWQLQALDSSGGPALPSVAFAGSGDAFVTWRPSLASGGTTVYAARRSAAGWQPTQPVSATTAADTRYPRVCVDSGGSALVLFQEKATASDPFQVWGRLFSGGAWSNPGRVQNSPNEGRFADCVRHSFNPLRGGSFVAWRETDPSDATRFRIVAAR